MSMYRPWISLPGAGAWVGGSGWKNTFEAESSAGLGVTDPDMTNGLGYPVSQRSVDDAGHNVHRELIDDSKSRSSAPSGARRQARSSYDTGGKRLSKKHA